MDLKPKLTQLLAVKAQSDTGRIYFRQNSTHGRQKCGCCQYVKVNRNGSMGPYPREMFYTCFKTYQLNRGFLKV